MANKKVTISKANNLIKEDYQKWAKNVLIFASPALLVLFADLSEFVPKNAAWGALALALYGIGIDLFKKWLKENRY
jgi:hypothetical protein